MLQSRARPRRAGAATRSPIGLGRILGLAAVSGLLGCGSDSPSSEGWRVSADAAEYGWLMSAWGPAEGGVVAVGGEDDQGAVLRYDGSAWSREEVGVAIPRLNWVHGFGPDDVTAVGRQGTVVHYDGTGWQLQPTPTAEELWGVWGATPDDLWAVGGSGEPEGEAVILRYDGSEWTAYPLPTLMRSGVHALFKVWGTSREHLLLVGQNGVVLRWDGQGLTEELVGTSTDLSSLWGTSDSRIVAVGGAGNAVVVAWDGNEWRVGTPDFVPRLFGVWMRESGPAHVVGVEGTVGRVNFETLEFEDESLDTRFTLHSVFGGSAGLLVTVGGNIFASVGPDGDPFEGIAYTRSLRSED